jgi:hypothetical protein
MVSGIVFRCCTMASDFGTRFDVNRTIRISLTGRSGSETGRPLCERGCDIWAVFPSRQVPPQPFCGNLHTVDRSEGPGKPVDMRVRIGIGR